jgi:hypothetical protein
VPCKEYDQALLDYYMRVLQQVMLVLDALTSSPWIDTNFKSLHRRMPWYPSEFQKASTVEVSLPKNWPALANAIAYTMRNYSRTGIFGVNVSKVLKKNYNFPIIPGLNISPESFYHSDPAVAIMVLLHEASHDKLSNFGHGLFGGDIMRIAGPGPESAWNKLVFFLRAYRDKDGVSLWDYILRFAGPRPVCACGGCASAH